MDIEKFKTSCKSMAEFTFALRRDEKDSYDISIHAGPGYCGDLLLKAAQLLELLPSGSNWAPALGWRSIYGMPLYVQEGQYIVIGVEEILRHPTRGAFPVVDINFYGELSRATQALDTYFDGKALPQGPNYRGVVSISDLDDYYAKEPLLIAPALRAWAAGENALFRTLALSESPFRISNHPMHTPFLRSSSNNLKVGRVDRKRWVVGNAKSMSFIDSKVLALQFGLNGYKDAPI